MKFLNNERMIIGYDLSDKYSQISYCTTNDYNVETLSTVAGQEVYNIPTVLCKREGANQWLYGKEALRFAEQGEGILVRNLLSLALDGENIQIEGVEYRPVSLLALFLKRSLGMLAQVAAPERIEGIMFTCENMNHAVVEVLEQVMESIKLKAKYVAYQSHGESFYYYMLRQPEDLWKLEVLLCEYQEEHMKVYRMDCNKNTSPVVAFVEEEKYPFTAYEPMPEEEALRREKLIQLDKELLQLTGEICPNRLISSVYLIGEGFTEEWLKDSLYYLCKGRRVFLGNNLFSKGACFGMLEKLQESEVGKSHVFMGNDKLTANVGMKMFCQDQEIYYALMDAGENWYDSEALLEFYIQDGNRVELLIDSLIGRGKKLAKITLEELPEGLSRLRMHLYLSDERHLQVEIEDMGFGEFRPATDCVWRETIEI